MTNKEIIFGAVYKLQKGANKLLKSVKGGMHGEYFAFQNDQAYYYFLPINANVNGGVKTYMVDTYMIDQPSYKNYEDLITIIKSWADPEKGSRIRSRCYDYYYSGIFEVTEETAPAFELVCNLSQVTPVDEDEAVKYLENEVFWKVQLYHEHNYSWESGAKGVTLVLKDALPNGEKSLKAVCNKIINLKINDIYYKDVTDELHKVLTDFPELCEEHQEEIDAANAYLRMLENFQQLMYLSLSPYKDILTNYLRGVKKKMAVKTKAGENIAEEENSDDKGISLALRPKKANSEGVHLMNRDELRECQEALNALWAYYEEGVEGSMWFRHNLDILQKNIHVDDEIID